MNKKEREQAMSEMKKEILDRGYITHALTDKNGRVKGISKEGESSSYNMELDKPFYWSEVYCEPCYMVTVIRKGMLLANPTEEELDRYLLQSMVNLGAK